MLVEIGRETVEIDILDALSGTAGIFEGKKIVTDVVLTLQLELLLRNELIAHAPDFLESFLDRRARDLVARLRIGIEGAGELAHIENTVGAIGPAVFLPEVL